MKVFTPIGNLRVWNAIAAVRISRSPETMSEPYDALNDRANRRLRGLTQSERRQFELDYLRANAPELQWSAREGWGKYTANGFEEC